MRIHRHKVLPVSQLSGRARRRLLRGEKFWQGPKEARLVPQDINPDRCRGHQTSHAHGPENKAIQLCNYPVARPANSGRFFVPLARARRSSYKTGITNPSAVLKCEVDSATAVNLDPATSALILDWLGHFVLPSCSLHSRSNTQGLLQVVKLCSFFPVACTTKLRAMPGATRA
jgi:hypothetical protein